MAKVDSVSEWGSCHALGSIINAAVKSAAITQAVAMTGSSAASHPTTPAPARAISPRSTLLNPPLPSRSDRTKTRQVPSAWVAKGIRLQRAPSARCASTATTSSTPQMSQDPRCGTVVRRNVSRRYGNDSAAPSAPPARPKAAAYSIILGGASRGGRRYPVRRGRPPPSPRAAGLRRRDVVADAFDERRPEDDGVRDRPGGGAPRVEAVRSSTSTTVKPADSRCRV